MMDIDGDQHQDDEPSCEDVTKDAKPLRGCLCDHQAEHKGYQQEDGAYDQQSARQGG